MNRLHVIYEFLLEFLVFNSISHTMLTLPLFSNVVISWNILRAAAEVCLRSVFIIVIRVINVV